MGHRVGRTAPLWSRPARAGAMTPGLRLGDQCLAWANGIFTSVSVFRGSGHPASPRSHRLGARLATIGLVFICAACTQAVTPATAGSSTDRASVAHGCPVEDFQAYIERFGRDLAFQKATTADPLTIARYDVAAEPEPRLVTEFVALGDITWPVMPPLDGLGAQGRVHEVAPADAGMEVRIRTPDTSDQQTYVFARVPCWQLQRVSDESI